MTKLHDIDGLNCHEAHVRAGQPGDELHYGWALGPGEVRYQHCWLVRDGELIDLFGWTEHEDLGVRLRLGAELCEDCGEEAGNHSADCPTWPDIWDDGSTGHE